MLSSGRPCVAVLYTAVLFYFYFLGWKLGREKRNEHIYLYTVVAAYIFDALVARDLKDHSEFRSLFLVLVMKTRSHCAFFRHN